MPGDRSLPVAAFSCSASARSFIVLTSLGRVRAQVTEATLGGTVVDGTGQFIPYPSVTVTRQETGQTRDVIGDLDGSFSFAGLAPGAYDVEVTSTGFKVAKQTGLRLNVGSTTVTVRLELANLEESVTVTASAITVQTSTEARLADSFTSKTITDIPLAQRDIIGVARLSAGATLIPGAANSTKLTSSPVVTVNGNRYRGNNYVLDGAMNSNPNNTGEPAIVPSARVGRRSAGPDAELRRRSSGAATGPSSTCRTRSGTQPVPRPRLGVSPERRAQRAELFRDDKPPQNFNQFGGNLGGPLVSNRTFFFGNYEGSRNDGRAARSPSRSRRPSCATTSHAPRRTASPRGCFAQFPRADAAAGQRADSRTTTSATSRRRLGSIPGDRARATSSSTTTSGSTSTWRASTTRSRGIDTLSCRWIAE